MKHFVVIANAYKDRNFALTNKIVAYIEQKGGTAKGLMSNVEAISDNEFELEDIPQDTQCILVLGGDGTLIRAATRVETLEIPLMGVNLGTLGYLCEVEEATVFDAIDSLMADKYMTEDRIMLTGHKRGTPNNAHNLTSKSIVLSGDDEIEIEILSRREQNDEMACVSYDGDTTAELAVGDRFVISKAANHTKICKLHQRSFLEILRKKMGNYS
ncbi:MAG: NAD(+)/NADH kinase [[Eubacterium] rectale]|nr:NAD(+)/NADH kinase [Agathobacter rectalis]